MILPGAPEMLARRAKRSPSIWCIRKSRDTPVNQTIIRSAQVNRAQAREKRRL